MRRDHPEDSGRAPTTKEVGVADGPVPAATILQVRTGAVGELDRVTVGGSGTVRSALGKRPRQGRIMLDTDGFGGDVQADRKNHGGPQKAVLVYPVEHYAHWQRELGRDLSARGLGENLRTAGWDESTVHPGDVFRIGTAAVRITAPRRPCYKLGLAHGVKEMAVRVQATGLTGFYLSVLEPGVVEAGDEVRLLERAGHDVTAFEVNRVMNLNKRDADGIRHVLTACEYLPQRWVAKMRSRLAASESMGEPGAVAGSPVAGDDDGDRLFGSA